MLQILGKRKTIIKVDLAVIRKDIWNLSDAIVEEHTLNAMVAGLSYKNDNKLGVKK
jgi:hypothetical protein